MVPVRAEEEASAQTTLLPGKKALPQKPLTGLGLPAGTRNVPAPENRLPRAIARGDAVGVASWTCASVHTLHNAP